MNLRPRPARSAAHAVRRGIVRGITCSALFAAFPVGAYALPINMAIQPVAPEHTDAAVADLAPAKGTQAWAIEKSGCVEAPGGTVGSGVVYTVVGSGWRYGGEDAVGRAFEQLVYDGVLAANEWTQPVDHGMRVGVFCR